MFTDLLTRVAIRPTAYYPSVETRSWRRQRRVQRLATVSLAAA